MTKVNRSRFSKIKQQWDILKMSSAYILAEKKIIEDTAQGNDPTGHDNVSYYFTTSSSPEEFHLEFSKPRTEKELLLEKAQEIRKQLDDAIHAEEYSRAEALQKLLNVIEKKYNKL